MSTLLAPDSGTRTSPVQASPAAERGPLVGDRARWLLAASGFVMLGFVFEHMAANLLAFVGADAFNTYAHWLRQVGTPPLPDSALLWVARVALAGTLVLHLACHLYMMTHPDAPSALTFGPADQLPPWYATLPVLVFQVSGTPILAYFHSSGQTRTAPSSRSRCLAKVVLRAPGRPQMRMRRPGRR
jgi:hypothetical protein